jgi:cytochrome c oxidase subunit IV
MSTKTTEHVAAPASLVDVWLALMALLAVTVGSALVHLGSLNVVINLSVSVAKTLLVATFYMHLRSREPWLRVVAAAGVVWLAMLIGLSLVDYLTRTELPSPW